MFDDIALFIHIVEQRGLAAAANKLRLPAATVTRRLKQLERALGCKLIHRSARQFYLTAEGEVYYQEYADLIYAMETKRRDLQQSTHKVSGRLKVLAPTNISIGLLQPMWSGFIKAYPDIQLELLLGNNTLDMLSAQADLALRIGPQPDSLLYQKRLGSVQTVLVASPDYLGKSNTVLSLADLQIQRIIRVKHITTWLLSDGNEVVDLRLRATTLVDDIRMAAMLAMDGVGVALLPMSEVCEELRNGRLVRVLPQWSGPVRELFAVWPSGQLLSQKAKCCRDYMLQFIANNELLNGAILTDIK
ncbi:LysR family transcriptional regulator [Motilimonas sp. 1_MG-2023]|uniref:LysR family transcriptional regulator n=1 Tax=Motilimonas sp. 1_MG-2023 TaxID=3062672 RepID=UPI0026E1E9CB|nr:LysR family transcriptional regulator [Motilimonas sp. 1_MG-2023]MDO6527897.1 LysR family transcriptional regulator [Motilimonas sp. 1_MG-2023]